MPARRLPAADPGSSTASSTARPSTRCSSRAAQRPMSSPTGCVVTVNYRYAPSVSEEEAEAHVRTVFDGFDVAVVDNAAWPDCTFPAACRLRCRPRAGGRGQAGLDRCRPLRRWGPRRQLRSGRPEPAHMDDEQCPVWQYEKCERRCPLARLIGPRPADWPRARTRTGIALGPAYHSARHTADVRRLDPCSASCASEATEADVAWAA